MREKTSKLRFILRVLVVTTCLLVVHGEKLPFKIYTSSDGLAHDSINKIVRDSRGFLWFCTGDGLSRFNGYSFKTYTQAQGLPSRSVLDLFETRDGTYLIATGAGLVVFDPLGRAYPWNVITGKLEQNGPEPPMFQTFAPPEVSDNRVGKAVYSVAQAANGTIYAGTNQGLYRFILTLGRGEFQRVNDPLFGNKSMLFGGLQLDMKGGLWVVTNGAIYRMTGNEHFDRIDPVGGREIFQDREGRIWVSSSGIDLGIRLFVFDGDVPKLARILTSHEGLHENKFSRVVAQANDGRIFIESKGQVGEYLPDSKTGETSIRYFESELVETGAVDSGGNVWLGTSGKGAWKLSSNGFVSYGPEAGLPADEIRGLYLDAKGDVYTAGENDRIARLHDGKVDVTVPRGFKPRFWGQHFLDLRSPDGDWWLPSTGGLYHYPAVEFAQLARTPPKRIYTVRDGLLTEIAFNLFQDSRGDLWISASNGKDSLHRWDHTTDRIQQFTEAADGLSTTWGGAISFGEDAAGDIWVGFYFGGLVRYRNGRFRSFSAADGIPEGYVHDFISDAQGHFWIATSSRGLFRVDEPAAESPKFVNVSISQGLLSNEATCLTNDKFGQIYVGTGRGLNRIDPVTQNIRAYTQADGLPGNYISFCHTDPNGVLWVVAANSLARFVPGPELASNPPPVFIDGITVNGSPRKLSEFGETKIENLALSSDQHQLQIDFFGLAFDAGNTLRYQYKLNDQNWSSPSDQRTIALNLSAGTYELTVRAVTADGVVSSIPATVRFTIARPVWQRWWFLALMALIVGAAVFALDRYRVSKAKQLQRAREERIAELQRVRTRIATDLHDDIGSSLTQIAVYSELARQKEGENGQAAEPLEMITNVSSELVDTMSDIVWAINPRKDHLQDLTQRMRRFAANVLSAKDIELEFRAPGSDQDIPLGANIRREVFLIFKETVNNIVKHSEAKQATINFELHARELEIRFRDDGKGFSPQADPPKSGDGDWKRFRGGNGLLNMKRRAQELGGSYEIESAPGQGTTVILRVPFQAADTAH